MGASTCSRSFAEKQCQFSGGLSSGSMGKYSIVPPQHAQFGIQGGETVIGGIGDAVSMNTEIPTVLECNLSLNSEDAESHTI